MKLVILSSAIWGSIFIKENLSEAVISRCAGFEMHTGKLIGQSVTLVEPDDESIPAIQDNLLNILDPDYVISLGDAFGCKKSLNAGDVIISSAASFLKGDSPQQTEEVGAQLKLVDLGLRATERFSNDERPCKVVVGKVFLNPGTLTTKRKLTFLPRSDIYCMDRSGFPLTQWIVDGKAPFVLIRTVLPAPRQSEATQFKWDAAKRNFWIIKGIFEGLKPKYVRETARKVDLI